MRIALPHNRKRYLRIFIIEQPLTSRAQYLTMPNNFIFIALYIIYPERKDYCYTTRSLLRWEQLTQISQSS